MILSEDRVSHIAHLVLDTLCKKKIITVSDMSITLRTVKQSITNSLSYDEAIDKKVRAKLASYSRPLPEGSSEWDVLYQKFYQEELQKRK